MSFFSGGNPVTKISWSAPTLNTDGSSITGALTYNLYIDDVQNVSFPGTLNPDGRYEYQLDQVPALDADGDYVLELAAVDEDGDESDRSGSITVTRLSRPNPPVGFMAE